jgi:hypothetical protein
MLNNEFLALPVMTKTGNQITFDIGRGFPVVAYWCQACGHVEFFYAPKTGFWEQGIPVTPAPNPPLNSDPA